MSSAVAVALASGRSDTASSSQKQRRASAGSPAAMMKKGAASPDASLSFATKRRTTQQTSPTRTYQTRSQTRASASSGSSAVDGKRRGPLVPITVALGLIAVLAAAAAVTFMPGSKDAVVDILAKSGFTAAFGLIFVSEIGDKTFFIAALLAMERGRAVVLAGATSALAIMTVISVAIGRLFSRLPESFSSSIPIGEYLAVALLLIFGVSTLRTALKTPEPGEKEGDEMEEAQEVVKNADGKKGWIGVFIQTFSLIFVAEWGDRSMLATIALGAAQNPFGVAAGATSGHFLATLIAVVGGSFLSKYISERAIGITGGTLFLVFAVATLFGVM